MGVDSDDPDGFDLPNFHGPLDGFFHGLAELVDGDHALFAFVLEQLDIAAIFLAADALDLNEGGDTMTSSASP